MPQLPHAYPFRLLDRVLMVEPGRWAVAVKRVTHADRLATPDGRLGPALLAEMMAQASGVALAASGTAQSAAVFAAIDRFRCRVSAMSPLAGDSLVITVRVVRRFGGAVRTHASVRAGTRRCAAAALVLRMGDAG